MKKIFLFVLFSLLLVNLCSAFMPLTHKLETDVALKTYQGNSDFYNTCLKYPNLCYVGNVLTDLSVVYYYVERGTKYEVTHSPGFCVNMMSAAVTEKEKACAIGSCAHAAQDYVPHTSMVPYAITHTGLPNEVIHVFAEQHMDNIVLKDHPEIRSEVLNLQPSDWQECIPLFKRVLLNYNDYKNEVNSGKIDDLINVFIGEVTNSIQEGNVGYSTAFESKVTLFGKINLIPTKFLMLYLGLMFLWALLFVLLIFRKNKGILNYTTMFVCGALFAVQLLFFITLFMGNAFTTFITVIKPFSNLVPIGSANTHLQNAIQNTQDLFTQGESFIAGDNPKIASGFKELKEANQKIILLDYFLIGILILLLGFLIYFNFRRKEAKAVLNL